MAISANMSDALMRAGMSILAANDGSRSGVSAIGMGALQGMDAYRQGVEREQAQQEQMQKQEALQSAMQGLPDHMKQLAIASPELAANMIANREMSAYKQELMAKQPLTPLQKSQLEMQERQIGNAEAGQQFNQQIAQDKLGLARQQFAFNQQQSQQNLQFKAQEMQQKMEAGVQLKPSEINSFRDDMTKAVEPFTQAQGAHRSIGKQLDLNTVTGDMSALFELAKLRSPGIVTADDLRTAGESGRLPAQLQMGWNRISQGTPLTDIERADIRQSADAYLQSAKEGAASVINDATRFAQQYGIALEDILPSSALPAKGAGGSGSTSSNASVVDFNEYFK